MEWNKELNELKEQERVEFWKASEGKHTIKFLDEGTPHDFEWEGEHIQKINFKIEVQNKPQTWSVTKGSTLTSLYGQIASIGVQRGKLTGTSINLLVKGEKLARQYIIIEALDLKPAKQERVGK
jgi:hypothetical protein